MQDDLIRLLKRLTDGLRGQVRHELVACAVEAVAADRELFSYCLGQCVRVRLRWHRLEERGVKDNHVRDIWEEFTSNFKALDVTRVVQGSERDELADLLNNLISDQSWLGEDRATLDDAVAHGHNVRLSEIRTVLLEELQDLAQTVTVVIDL